ncbi:g-D-glutamyl-meso-diaminopimelate peptidase [Bacillus pakistanensis]|uniref:G-D-glutamyl-meso-diaminopimelate peptidase n=1 Tax=Rossellomorea pakistanensis TaxID=992288 RepID=A0ABS2NA11_9BACI|nr:M14 family zinc carboxypeptidase [Bacillus pakistanensis]MBM7584664.1 g-D-glutamyl-meso-diaminopimelate peptidase [Bacillus pakistanensis]
MKVTIRKGDTLWYYSQLFYLPFQLLLDSNRQQDVNALMPGMEIEIPGFQSVPYMVEKGDTFWTIARQRNLSLDAIFLLNPNVDPNLLSIGKTLLLPIRVTNPIIIAKQAYSSEQLSNDLKRLSNVYPFITINEIGKSVLNQPIQEILIGNGVKKVHFNGSFHANEWITTPIIMKFLNDYLVSLTNHRSIRGVRTLPLYNSVSLSLVPMVNPDGVDLVLQGPPPSIRERLIEINRGSEEFTGWKANINGVDLNNQYPAKWEIEKERKEEKSPAPRDFPGYKPLSEPEAIAMADLARETPFDRMLALHTQGKEFYWGYEGLEPPESERLAEEFARVSGYESVRYVDSYAGYKDWFIKEFQKPGFTMELGKGINPLPLSQFDEIYQDILGVFLVSMYQ